MGQVKKKGEIMFWKRKRKIKNLSLTGRNKRESISIVVNERKKQINILRQDASRISRDIYHLENIKGDCKWLETNNKNQEGNYLAKDIKEIIIETDEKDPKVIARINDILSPSEGYRVRVKFNYN